MINLRRIRLHQFLLVFSFFARFFFAWLIFWSTGWFKIIYLFFFFNILRFFFFHWFLGFLRGLWGFLIGASFFNFYRPIGLLIFLNWVVLGDSVCLVEFLLQTLFQASRLNGVHEAVPLFPLILGFSFDDGLDQKFCCLIMMLSFFFFFFLLFWVDLFFGFFILGLFLLLFNFLSFLGCSGVVDAEFDYWLAFQGFVDFFFVWLDILEDFQTEFFVGKLNEREAGWFWLAWFIDF